MRIRGTIACIFALAALLLPLPTLHYGASESLHMEAVSYHGESAHTCDCEHSDSDVPDKADNDTQAKQPLWVSNPGVFAPGTVAPTHGFSLPAAQPAPGFAPLQCIDIRGPPRRMLTLFCTLRV